MDFTLSENNILFQQTARKFAEAEIVPLAKKLDETGEFPIHLFKKMAKEGFFGLLVPEEFGGANAGAVNYSLIISEIARACASTSVTMAVTNMVCDAINIFGNEAQKKKYISLLTSGEGICASFCLTEPDSGSDAASLRTKAIKDGNHYILNGEKVFITSGEFSKVLLVMARTSDHKTRGISAFLVEPHFQGFKVTHRDHKMGLKSSNTVALSFEDCVVPKENLLKEEGIGFTVAMRALDGGRIGVASQAIGIAQAAFESSLKYSQQRIQFSSKLSEFQAIQNMLANMATRIEASRLLALQAAALKDLGLPFTKEAAMAKYFATENAIRICEDAVQIHGGYGYINEFPVERYLRDVRVTAIYEGTSQVQKLVIARKCLEK